MDFELTLPTEEGIQSHAKPRRRKGKTVFLRVFAALREIVFCIHRTVLGLARLLIGTSLMLASAASFAQDKTALFKVISVKDDVVIALSASDAATLGGNDVTHIGRALTGNGELTVWQYATRKAADGQLEQAPAKRVSLIGRDSLRVEPYTTPLRVVAVPAN
jgi:hypothetical protein